MDWRPILASGQRIPRNSDPMGRGPMYVAGGPTSAPKSPHEEVTGYADGSGSNCLIHSLSHILDAAECGGRRPLSREKCVYVRTSLVGKCGRVLHAELELEAWRRLIIAELGGRPNDWRVLFWSGSGVRARRRRREMRAPLPSGRPSRPLRAHLSSNWRGCRGAARIAPRTPDSYRGGRG